MRLLHKKTVEWQRPVLTEEKCHELLESNPLDSDVTFLSVPWSTLIDQIDHGSSEDKERAKLTLEEISSCDAQGGFSVCQHDRFHTIIPTLKKAGISTLFAPHMASPEGYTTKGFYFKPDKKSLPEKISERASNHSGLYIDGIQIETIPLWPVVIGDPGIKKDIWYSYIGSYGPKHISDIRKKIMDDTHPLDCIAVNRKGWQFDIEVYQEQILANSVSGFQKYVNRKKSEFYQRTLSRSRFALCPSGTGPAIIRLLEALGSGAIPVILSDAMTFPTLSDVHWEDCCLKIAEKDYNTLRDTLSNITLDKEEEMRKKCLEYYKFASGDNYVRNIREFYNARF
jgi:hypothetical protein